MNSPQLAILELLNELNKGKVLYSAVLYEDENGELKLLEASKHRNMTETYREVLILALSNIAEEEEPC